MGPVRYGRGGGMAEEKRDLLDEVIDIQKDLRAIQSPLDAVVGALDSESAPQEPEWDPSAYKERPRANALRCIRCTTGSPEACSACMDACPVGAISVEGDAVTIGPSCRKCGVCLAVCPTEALADRTHTPKRLYDRIAKAAGAYERCYVTCTRALGRNPEPNEIVLPCVAALGPETLFAVMCDYPNVSVYLPFGVCDRCRTTTGEAAYVDHIGTAEAWSGRSMGLEMDADALEHKMKRSYERSQFVDGLVGAGKRMLATTSVAGAGAAAVARRVQNHAKRLNAINRQLDKMVGPTNAQRRRRTLTQRRQLLLGALQRRPKLASRIAHEVPVCDSSLCTMCGECAKACPLNACAVDETGHFSVADVYCASCGACVLACREGALAMRPGEPAELLVPDDEAKSRAEEAKRQKEEVARLKEEGRRKLDRALDFLERLDTDDGEGS